MGQEIFISSMKRWLEYEGYNGVIKQKYGV